MPALPASADRPSLSEARPAVTVVPTGALHEVPLDDLFFSTTDAKGVIDEANEVFTRNARYTREQLIGAPHNIIRHPDMPGGVFRIMWDQLEAGTPVCAYVLNLAGDGSAYWAFATVVPIGERYLSVRARPCNLEARDLLHGLYTDVRAQELKARETGASAADAALLGRELLGAALEANGFGSYAELQLDLVPAEVAARDAAGPSLPSLDEGSQTLRTMVGTAGDARAILGTFSDDLTASLTDADALARDLRRCRGALANLDDVGRDLGRLGLGVAPSEVTSGISDLQTTVDALSVALTGVVRTRKQLRLDTAIARLQAEAIARYVVAVAHEVEDPRVSERALASLTEALLSILDADLGADATASAELGRQAGAATDALTVLRDRVLGWRAALASAGGGPAVLARLVDLDVALEAVGGLSTRIRQHAETVASATAGLDRDKLAEQLASIVDLAGTV